MDSDNDQPPETLSQQLPHYPANRTRSRRKWPIIVIILVILLAGGAGAYWYLKIRTKPAAATVTAKSSQTATTPPQAVTPPSSSAAPAGTTAYTSTQSNLNLSFNYPTDWTVSPKQTTATDTTPITITSPTATIAAADGSSVTGKVIVTVRAGGSAITELASAATAAITSTQIGYIHPTASQRQYPYLTYVHFTSSSNVDGAFEETMVTGGDQFTKGEAVSSDNLQDVDPLISASFYRCDTASCSTPSVGTLAITSGTWQNATLFQTTAAILASFKIN